MPRAVLTRSTTASDKCTWASWKERHSYTLSAIDSDVWGYLSGKH